MPRQLLIAISLSIAVLLGIVLVWPNYQELKSLNLEIGQKSLDLRHKEEYFSKLYEISQDLKDYEESLAKIDSALPLDPSMPALFDFIQKAAAQSGLVLRGISFSAPPAGKGEIKEIGVPLSLSGSYPAFKDFLLRLENSSRLIEVEGISFSSSEKGRPFDFSLKIKVHSY